MARRYNKKHDPIIKQEQLVEAPATMDLTPTMDRPAIVLILMRDTALGNGTRHRGEIVGFGEGNPVDQSVFVDTLAPADGITEREFANLMLNPQLFSVQWPGKQTGDNKNG